MYDIVKFRRLDQALDTYAGAVMINTILMTVALYWLFTGKGWWTIAWMVAWILTSALTGRVRKSLMDTIITPTPRL